MRCIFGYLYIMDMIKARQPEHINKNQNNYLCSLPCLPPPTPKLPPSSCHTFHPSVTSTTARQTSSRSTILCKMYRTTLFFERNLLCPPHCFHRLQTYSSPSLPQFYQLPPLVFPMSQPFGSHSNLSLIFLRNCSELNWFIFIFSFIFPHICLWILFFVDLVWWMGKLNTLLSMMIWWENIVNKMKAILLKRTSKEWRIKYIEPLNLYVRVFISLYAFWSATLQYRHCCNIDTLLR